MRLSSIVLAALALASCQPQGLQITDTTASRVPVKTTAVERNCAVHIEGAWIEQEAPTRRYTSEAQTTGSTCDFAVATLVIRASEGSPIFTWAGAARDIFGLKDAKNPTAMKAALLDWIDQSNAVFRTTADLPRWEETEGQPKRAEFPFMPAEWLARADWDALRAEERDVFCFPQGGESLNCAVLREGRMDSIGLQLFPG
jgi:hypothetical protein